MKQKDIHIVFGKAAKGTFIYSKAFDMNTIQLICLEDCLNIGPIYDLDSVEEIEKRNDWLLKVFDVNSFSFINKDIENIKTFIENYENERIYLWTGYCASDILNTARLLCHLPAPCNNIFIIDFSNVSVKNRFGTVVYPKALYVTEPSQVGEIAKHFYQLTGENLSKLIQLWEKIKVGHSMLRILDKNGQILEKEETFFDSVLVSYCTNEFQKPARIIGQVLADIDFNVGDGFLNWRLKQLSLMNKIETRGSLNEMRDYEVKLI